MISCVAISVFLLKHLDGRWTVVMVAVLVASGGVVRWLMVSVSFLFCSFSFRMYNLVTFRIIPSQKLNLWSRIQYMYFKTHNLKYIFCIEIVHFRIHIFIMYYIFQNTYFVKNMKFLTFILIFLSLLIQDLMYSNGYWI